MNLSFINGLYCEFLDFVFCTLHFVTVNLVTVVSIETVGFGDITPKNVKSRIFALFYNTIGILNFGLAVTTGRDTIIESFEHSYRKRLSKLVHHRLARKERKIRKKVIKQALINADIHPYIYQNPDDIHTGISPDEHTFLYNFTHNGIKAAQHAAAHARSGRKPILNIQALSAAQLEEVDRIVEEKIQKERELQTEFHAYPHMLQSEVTFEEMREDLNRFGGTRKLLESLGLAGSTAAMEQEQRQEFMVKVTISFPGCCRWR
jgi:Ion channel